MENFEKYVFYSEPCSSLIWRLYAKWPFNGVSDYWFGLLIHLINLFQNSQSLEKWQNLQVSSQELSRLATPFLPSHRPNLPCFTDSPEGVANLVVSTVIQLLVCDLLALLSRQQLICSSNLLIIGCDLLWLISCLVHYFSLHVLMELPASDMNELWISR